jgi:hypothetical protein
MDKHKYFTKRKLTTGDDGMKWISKQTAVLIVSLILSNLIPFNAVVAQASETGIIIDGYYDDWSDKPYSWEYSHDNRWQIENYWDGTANITKEYRDENGNPYNLEIRHKMALFFDGEYVYLHILISSNPGAGLHAEDFRFYIDGEMAAFRVTYTGGDRITKTDKKEDSGIYSVEVRHRETDLSNTVVVGAEAAFTKKDYDLNNEIELKIPIIAMTLQNPNISTDSVRTIEFFTPNLMYRRIACSGVSTGPMIGIVLSVAAVGGVLLWNKRKSRSRQV